MNDDNSLNNDPLAWTADDEAQFNTLAQASEPEAEETPEAPEADAGAADEPASRAQEPDDEDDDEPGDPKRPGFVPHRKFHKAREKLKATEAELAREREERVRLDERTNALLERLRGVQQAPAAPQQPVQPEPVRQLTPDEDVFGWAEQTGKTVESLAQKLERLERGEQQRQTVQHVVEAVQHYEQQFAKDKPDYTDAAVYLKQARTRELMAFGLPEAQARAQVSQEMLRFAHDTLQRRQNPAETVYKWAEARGYAKAAPEPAKEDAGPVERIARTAEAQARSRSLSGGGGAPADTKIDARSLLRMSEDEFAKFSEANKSDLDRILMG